MSKWAAIAKIHFLHKAGEGTPKTSETRLMGVMGVGVPPIYKNESANDDGLMARLIAAAMKACDHHGDGEQARADMRQQCLDTPPHLRADLLDHFQQTYPGRGKT